MAIKRLDPNAVFKIVSRFDEALEEEETVEQRTVKEEGKPDYVKPTRWEQYLENFDLSVLKFKEGMKPTLFHVRCLKANELAEINQKYQQVDVVNKKINYKDTNKMMLEIFDKSVVGMQDGETGPMEKVTSDDVGFHVATEVGSVISLLTTLNKNLKKA